MLKSSVTKQKGKSEDGADKKTRHAKFPEKRIFPTSWYAHVRKPLRNPYICKGIRNDWPLNQKFETSSLLRGNFYA